MQKMATNNYYIVYQCIGNSGLPLVEEESQTDPSPPNFNTETQTDNVTRSVGVTVKPQNASHHTQTTYISTCDDHVQTVQKPTRDACVNTGGVFISSFTN